ncbi:hypothetical protein SBA3_2210022 [Candidatus Sulfopaludibacter sp. SbA3]|nr:hypothetical protein SBA3_2210022 [Candidatus Sulfopaludibacter sp. SbA3]
MRRVAIAPRLPWRRLRVKTIGEVSMTLLLCDQHYAKKIACVVWEVNFPAAEPHLRDFSLLYGFFRSMIDFDGSLPPQPAADGTSDRGRARHSCRPVDAGNGNRAGSPRRSRQ